MWQRRCGPSASTTASSGTGESGDTTPSSTETSPEDTTGDATVDSGDGNDTLDSGWIPDMGDEDPCGVDCTVWELGTCAEGQKCLPKTCEVGQPWDSNKCRPLIGDHQLGEACDYDNDVDSDSCAEGLMCYGWDDQTQQGECMALCQGSLDDPQCPSGYSCSSYNQGILPLCVPLCDPLAQDCEGGGNCVPNPQTPGFFCTSAFNPDAGYGDSCLHHGYCSPGHLCVDVAELPAADCVTEEMGCCSPYCDLGLPNACPTGTQCIALQDVPPGYEQVGVCKLGA